MVTLPDRILVSTSKEVKAVRGNGFCFLGAVTKVLEVDHKTYYTCSEGNGDNNEIPM